MNEVKRLRAAIDRLKNIRETLQSKADRNAIDVAIEHIDARMIDIVAGRP